MKVILISSDGFGSMIFNTKNAADVNHECFLDTKGFCFICVKKLSYEEGAPPPPPQSLDWLESHLDISFKKWLVENEFISETTDHPILLKLNEKRVNYQVKLCSDCVATSEALSMSCGQSTAGSGKELDVISTLRVIQNIIEESDKSDRMDEFYQENMSRSTPENIRKASLTSIGRRLRREIIEQCKLYHERSLKNMGERTNDEVRTPESVSENPAATSASHILVLVDPTGNFEADDVQPKSAPNCPDDFESTTAPSTDHAASISPTLDLELSETDFNMSGLPVFDEDELARALGRSLHASTPESLDGSQSQPTPPPPFMELGLLGDNSGTEREPEPSTSASSLRMMTRNSSRSAALASGSCQPSQKFRKSPNISLKKKMASETEQSCSSRQCIFCSGTVRMISEMEIHLRTHTKEAPYFCTLCDGPFSTRGNLGKHLKIHQKSRRRSFRCDLCPAKFFDLGNLHVHQRTHNKDNLLACDSCPMLFKTKWNLKMHQARKHFQGATVKCEVCGKEFGNEVFRNRHGQQSHGKGYPCNICQMVYSAKHSLKNHKLIHNSKRERLFGCDSCGKRFYTKGELKTHLERHANNAQGVRPHCCDVCRMGFVTKSDLSAHKLRVHSK